MVDLYKCIQVEVRAFPLIDSPLWCDVKISTSSIAANAGQ